MKAEPQNLSRRRLCGGGCMQIEISDRDFATPYLRESAAVLRLDFFSFLCVLRVFVVKFVLHPDE